MIFARFTLLGVFVAAGVALAICLGLSTGEPPLPAAASVAEAKAAPAEDSERPAQDHKSDLDVVESDAPKPPAPGPEVIETSQPRSEDAVPGRSLADVAAAPVSAASAPLPPQPAGPVSIVPYPAHTHQVAAPQADDRLLKAIEYLTNRLGPESDGAAAEAPAEAPAKTSPKTPAEALSQTLPEAVPAPKPAEAPATLPLESSKPAITADTAGEGDGKLRMQFSGSDIREVLDALAAAGNLNILASNNVQGTVSATLNGVDVDSALDAILRSTGFVAKRESNFIYVGTPQDFESLEQSLDTIGTRVYRPNYVTAAELQALVLPLLTQGVGVVSVSTPAEQGIASDATNAGGDTYAGSDVVLVRDYEAVLAQVDQVVAEIDVRPMQVAIEAMILSVKLSDGLDFGVDFELLRNKEHVRLDWGDTLASVAGAAASDATAGTVDLTSGLKFAFLDDSLGVFLHALESIGDTNVIATPRLMVLNKHRAEILIGEELGYVSTTITETSSSQSVEFLEVGAQLRLRPFISSDGQIRMEIHPELSTGSVDTESGFTLPNKETTQVTTNIMVPDGATMVIGGLMREELKTTATQVPLFGSLPLVGVAFRNKSEETERREIIVLITPHIVYDHEAAAEGDMAACEFHRRQATYAEKMSPLSRQHISRSYFRKAQEAWAAGDRRAAMRFAEMAVYFNPTNREAIDLRSNIWLGQREGEHTLEGPPVVAPGPPVLEGGQLAPWVLDDLEQGAAPPPPVPQLPLDPGIPGPHHSINRPRLMQ